VSRAAIFASFAGCWTSTTPAPTTPPPQPPSASLASLTGICTDGVTGQPLANASVQIFSGTGRGGRSVTTDAQGRYVANDLEPGSYGVQCRAANDTSGVVPQTFHVRLAAGDAKRIDARTSHRDWSNLPTPYGAPPARRRVV
jgi:hypothetical protein